MDMTKEHYKPNPREGANIFSKLFFTHTIGMFRKGYRKTLELEDLYSPLNSDRSKKVGDRLEKKWNQHLEHCKKNKKSPSLLKTLAKAFWPDYLFLAALTFVMEFVFVLMQPIMLGEVLDYCRPNTDKTKEEALIYAAGLIGVTGGNMLMSTQHFMLSFQYGMRIRVACCSLIYKKALRLSRTALGETASGKVVNLLSNDVSRFDVATYYINYIWVAPVFTCIVAYFIWEKAEWAGLIGMVPVLLVAPFQSYTGKLSSMFRRQMAYKTDIRVRLMDEIISGIQVIKMYAWEKHFEKAIKMSRINELRILKKIFYVRGFFTTFNLFTDRLALFCSLLTMVLTNKPITAATVFVFMSYYNILSQSMSTIFVRGISEIAELLVAVKRLQEFLMLEEFEDNSRPNNNNESKINPNVSVCLNTVTASWNISNSETVVNNFNLSIDKGKLIGIIGPVGSGKSSFLQMLLGELKVITGDMIINGKISYASQEPWIFAATLRQNILFGKEYNKERYNEVVKVCALERDFKQFEKGDLVIVGERGVSLSGGQKARINLARAVYREADIYLLDDPLSAVDIHVATQLFDECINGYLKRKTRILVTHQIQYLKEADLITILKDGTIEASGTFHDLSDNKDGLYAGLMQENPDQSEDYSDKASEKTRTLKQKRTSISSTISNLSLIESLQEELDVIEEEIKLADIQEESSKGKVQGSLFLKYLFAGGHWCLVLLVMLLFLLAQGAASSVDYFVSFWINIEEFKNVTSTVESEYRDKIHESLSTEMCLYIYAGLIVALFVIALTRSILFFDVVMANSKNLHNSMFQSIVYTTMRFFDTNSSGRILNRFSKDIGICDDLLAKGALETSQSLLIMFGSIVLVAIVNPIFLGLVAILAILFYPIQRIYFKSSKNIKRLEGMLRSPIFTHLNSSIQGLTTIRAFHAQDILAHEFDKHQDLHTSAFFMYIVAIAACGACLNVLSFIFITFVTFSFLIFGKSLLGEQVGLALTQAISITGILNTAMCISTEVVNQLMSVERVLEYCNLLEEQQPLEAKTPPKTWPDSGRIVFSNTRMRYSPELPLVLKDLNLVIQPNEKVGIVGRTGAGKSSLIAALFRLAFIEGKIQIDDVDTALLNLQFLRSKISIIPQDPVLFTGSLRYNLDPFEEYPDDVLWNALKDVELKDPANIINRLDSVVIDRGSNYSVGQRQLICLARALIRKNKILMLDEATANVDLHTDALIQKTIRHEFANCTVLTVAHRLNTIMDSDKVAVIEDGTVAEFNHPYLLLSRSNGKFAEMVKSSGSLVAKQLMNIARNSYQSKYGVSEH